MASSPTSSTTAAERPTVRVLRWRRWDDDLHTIASGIYGYQAECPCGHKGERRQVIATARRDLRAHLDYWHRPRGDGDLHTDD